jgi:hypothetical protein
VLAVIVTISGYPGVIYAVLTVIVIIKGGLYSVLTVIVRITGKSMCSLSSYCDDNGDVYM